MEFSNAVFRSPTLNKSLGGENCGMENWLKIYILSTAHTQFLPNFFPANWQFRRILRRSWVSLDSSFTPQYWKSFSIKNSNIYLNPDPQNLEFEIQISWISARFFFYPQSISDYRELDIHSHSPEKRRE